MFDEWLLPLVVFVPLVGAALLALVPKGSKGAIHGISLLSSGIALILGIVALFRFDFGRSKDIQFDVNASWISSINASTGSRSRSSP